MRPTSGATVCWKHGASAPQVKRKAAANVATEAVRAELAKMGVPVSSPLEDTLPALIDEARGNVAFLRAKVQALHQDYVGVRPDDGAGDAEPNPSPGLLRAIAGPNHLGDGAPDVFVNMYDAERDRLAKLAKMALDVGLEERKVRLDEARALMVAELLRAVFADSRFVAAVGSGDSSTVAEVGLGVFVELAEGWAAG